MSTIVLADQIVVGLGSGDVLSLPDTSGLGNKQVSIEVVGSATLRPATGGKINGSTGDTVLTEGSYVLSTTGNSGAGWITLQGSSGVAGVTSVSGTSGQISSTGGTTPVLAFTWSASANQLVGLNSGGTAYEGKTLFAGANMSINHTANGVTFTASGGSGSQTVYYQSTTLTNTQVKDLFNTPITLVNAVAGKVILPFLCAITVNNSGGHYAGGGTVRLQIAGGSQTVMSTASTTITNPDDGDYMVTTITTSTGFGPSTVSSRANTDLTITNITGVFTDVNGGGGPVTVEVWYVLSTPQ